MGGDQSGFLYTIGAFFIYNILGIFSCLFIKSHMTEFMVHLASEHDISQDPAVIDAFGANANVPKVPKEKKLVEIPEFLFKYSSTFFKTATKKEVLFKKLFSPQKVGKRPLGEGVKPASERFKSKDDSSKAPQVDGKSLKKTDLSMINFHLNVQGNQELMKHYRYSLLTQLNVLPPGQQPRRQFPTRRRPGPARRGRTETGGRVAIKIAATAKQTEREHGEPVRGMLRERAGLGVHALRPRRRLLRLRHRHLEEVLRVLPLPRRD